MFRVVLEPSNSKWLVFCAYVVKYSMNKLKFFSCFFSQYFMYCVFVFFKTPSSFLKSKNVFVDVGEMKVHLGGTAGTFM